MTTIAFVMLQSGEDALNQPFLNELFGNDQND